MKVTIPSFTVEVDAEVAVDTEQVDARPVFRPEELPMGYGPTRRVTAHIEAPFDVRFTYPRGGDTSHEEKAALVSIIRKTLGHLGFRSSDLDDFDASLQG